MSTMPTQQHTPSPHAWPGWGGAPAAAPLWAAPPPQQQPQQPRHVKRLRLEEEEQLLQQQQQQQQGFAGDPPDAPAPQRRRLNGGYSAWSPPTLGLQQQQLWHLQQPSAPLSPPQGLPQQKPQQPQQPAQPAARWIRADTSTADLAPAGSLDSTDSEAEGPTRQRRKSGGAEYRLMLPTPLPHAIPLPPPWQQLPLARHPANLAHAVIPYSPQQPLAELAGLSAQHPVAGGASSNGTFQQQIEEMAAAAAAADGMVFLGPQMRRLHLTFDHERPLPGDLPSPAPTTTAAAPTFVFEELPRAAECVEAMEE